MDRLPQPCRKTCKRYDVLGDAHWLTFSCCRRQPLLKGERACHWLVEAVNHARRDVHEKIAYIHAHPVRRGLVNQPRDWPWSSWRAWHE